jgi:serine phosphatase RsbU (regulator of sigma subunit)
MQETITYNILYVDDEDTNLRIFQTAFRREYNVLLASSGKEALDILKKEKIHLLITDQKMPEMTGTQLLEKTVKEYPDIVRMILTGFSDIESIIQAINKAGIYQYITKPWDRGEMQLTIEKALQAYSLRNERERLIQKLQEANEQLEHKVEERTKELAERGEQLADALQRVQDSIRYARRIQRAVLPSQDSLAKAFREHFVYYSPKSIVSGDFYWLAEKKEQGNHKIFLALADCTGHGVPGALMSMVGDSLLNNIIHDQEIHQPAQILQKLAEGIQKQLNQDATQNRDGMDIGLVVIDKNRKKMFFAGAKQDLVYVQKGKLEALKGDGLSAGGESKVSQFQFTEYSLDIQPDTTYYLYSDGFQDQFGGKEDKKFSSKRLRDLLHEQSSKSLAQQGKFFQETFEAWRGAPEKQIDDVTLLGFRL